MILFTEEQIKKGFIESDDDLINQVYKAYYPIVKRFVLYNSGNVDDAKDLIQEAFMIVYQKVQNDDFFLSSSFLTYFYSIVKNLWLKELRKRRNRSIVVKDVEDVESLEDEVEIEGEFYNTKEYFLFRLYFHELNKSCKRILKLILNKVPYEEIAQILNLKSPEVVRRRKYRCKESLVEKIKNDSRFIQIDSK